MIERDELPGVDVVPLLANGGNLFVHRRKCGVFTVTHSWCNPRRKRRTKVVGRGETFEAALRDVAAALAAERDREASP